MADHHCRVEEEQQLAHSSIWIIAAWQGQMICVVKHDRAYSTLRWQAPKNHEQSPETKARSLVLLHSHWALSTTKRLNRTAAVGIENGQETARLMTVDSPGGPWPAGTGALILC